MNLQADRRVEFPDRIAEAIQHHIVPLRRQYLDVVLLGLDRENVGRIDAPRNALDEPGNRRSGECED